MVKKSTSLLPTQTTLKTGSIDKISAKLCLQDHLYLFADFEEIFKIGESNIKILKSKIIKTFLKGDLIYDLSALFTDKEVMELSPEFFIKTFNVQETEKDEDWNFYEQGILEVRSNDRHEWYKTYLFPIIDNLAIHIADLITVLRNCNLLAEAKFFSSIELKKTAKKKIGKLKTTKRNEEIIEQYTIIFKDDKSLSVTDIAKLIEDKSSYNLSQRTIADIITEHHRQYVNDVWKKYLMQKEERTKEIMLGIDYADLNKNKNGLLPKITIEQPVIILNYLLGEDMYSSNQDFIQSLWKKYQGKPTEKQVAEELDNNVKEKIISRLCIQPHKLDQMTEKLPRPTPPPPAYL